MVREIFEIYERNFPFSKREGEIVLHILNHESNIVFEKRDNRNQLIGVSVVNRNTVLLLCVDEEYRNQGIGTELLAASEKEVKKNGYDKIVVGNGFDYIMPGVPTAKRYFDAENEELFEGVEKTASDFFESRGYRHAWECNCFDMSLSLEQFEKNADGLSTGGTISYRWGTRDDRMETGRCVESAWREFAPFYEFDGLYDEEGNPRVLAAVTDSGEVAGAVIVKGGPDGVGSLGCLVVSPAFRGRHIAVNLVLAATERLKNAGMNQVYLGFTYTGLDHMYGYAGYKICVYYMMAEKKL